MIKKHLLMLAIALTGLTSLVSAKKDIQPSSKGGAGKPLHIVGYNAGEIFKNSKQANDIQEQLMQKRQEIDMYLRTQQSRKDLILKEIQAENDKATARIEEIRTDASLSEGERETLRKTAEEEARNKLEPLYSQVGSLDQETRMTHGMRMQALQSEGQNTHQAIMDKMKEAVEAVGKEEEADLALDLGLTFYAPGVKDLTAKVSKILDEEYKKELEDQKDEEGIEEEGEGDPEEA